MEGGGIGSRAENDYRQEQEQENSSTSGSRSAKTTSHSHSRQSSSADSLPTFIGKHRLQAAISHLNTEINIIEVVN